MIPRCILTIPFVPTSNSVYGPSLGADHIRRRPGFRNKIRSPTLYLCLILFIFPLLLEVAIFACLLFLILSQFAWNLMLLIISLPNTS
jgi:hypothetical protein